MILSRNDLGHLYAEISEARTALLQVVYDAHAPAVSKYTASCSMPESQTGSPSKGGSYGAASAMCAIRYSMLEPTRFRFRQSPNRWDDTRRPTFDTLDDLRAAHKHMSDKFFGLRAVLQLESAVPGVTADFKAELLASAKAEDGDPIGCEQYVQAISCVDCPLHLIEELVAEPFFDINLAHARTVARMVSEPKAVSAHRCRLKLTEKLFII